MRMPQYIAIAPVDQYARIWRYMDFSKFVNMLATSSLYFPRADKLGDPYEGSLPIVNYEAQLEALSEFGGEEQARAFLERSDEASRYFRAWAFINSWHLNERENYAMWKIYAGGQKSIAITSTYLKLRQALPEEVLIGLVQYIDYEVQGIPRGNALHAFFHKRDVFQYERELRALVTGRFPAEDLEGGGFRMSLEGIEEGRRITVVLPELIDSVYVSPNTEPWFEETVNDVLERYGLSLRVERSSMDVPPNFAG